MPQTLERVSKATMPRVLSAHLPSPPNIAFHSIFFAFAVGAAVIRREWFHKAFAVFALVGFVLYIGALFARLR